MNEPTSIQQIAQLLADEHAEGDEGMAKILWFRHDREIRLVEISHSVGNTGEALPFRFTADPPDVPFESVVVLLGSEDGRKFEQGDLDIPGWDMAQVTYLLNKD